VDTFPARDIAYLIRLDEIGWGCVLLALTIAIHAAGTFQILRLMFALRNRMERARLRELGVGIIILTLWLIVLVHLGEVVIWAVFFVWKDAQPNVSSAFYNGLLNYTMLQAGYLPQRWRLLEGMLGIAGLLTFAWSTTIFFWSAPKFVQEAMDSVKEGRSIRESSAKSSDK
jgi:hypothetical protein